VEVCSPQPLLVDRWPLRSYYLPNNYSVNSWPTISKTIEVTLVKDSTIKIHVWLGKHSTNIGKRNSVITIKLILVWYISKGVYRQVFCSNIKYLVNFAKLQALIETFLSTWYHALHGTLMLVLLLLLLDFLWKGLTRLEQLVEQRFKI
jgi:hypothetical protein